MIEIPDSNIEQFIAQLAEQYDVQYERTHGDGLAETFTRLSGDDVSLDETEPLLLALERAKVITQEQALELFNRYRDGMAISHSNHES